MSNTRNIVELINTRIDELQRKKVRFTHEQFIIEFAVGELISLRNEILVGTEDEDFS